MSGNQYNLGVYGWGVSSPGPWIRDYAHDIDTSNTVNGKPIYYLVDESDRIIDSSTNAGYVALVNCTNITVKNLTLSHNHPGVLLIGSSDSRIENLNVSNCHRGVSLLQSSGNTLARNTLWNNYEGIHLTYSSNNTLNDNTMLDNSYNFDVDGSELSHFIQNIDTSNTINGKPIYYWVDEENKRVPADASYVGIINCKNIIVEDLTLRNNSKGMLLAYSANLRIENVNVSDNWNYGIYLYSSSNSTLSNNTVSNNEHGICIEHSFNNTFYLNNFFDSIDSYDSTNTWNSPEEITYSYNGNTYTSRLGNYWSDYEDEYPNAGEIDSTGIWDTPYSIIGGDSDSYPLVERFENYVIGGDPRTPPLV
jgi:parallel beta-helix repeat (two copies)/parallel beta-helix repeat (two copies)/parallel beta-helix repeat (two copies)